MKEKLLRYSVFIFGISISFSTKLANLSLIIFLIIAILNIDKQRSFNKKKYTFLVSSTIVFVLPYFIGLVNSHVISDAINQLGKKSPYLIVPIILFFLPKKTILKLKIDVLKGLVIGCVFSSLLLIIMNFYEYYLTRPLFFIDENIFNFYYTNYNYTNLLDIHPVYLGSYYILALSIILTEKKNILYILILLISITFLNSRIIFFLTVISFLSIFASQKAFFKKNKIILLVISFLITFFLCSDFFKSTHVYKRVVYELKWDLTEQVNTEYSENFSGDSRFSRWKVCLGVIKKKTFLGHGFNVEKTLLEEEFRREGMIKSVYFKYDAHNQFFSFWIQFGIIGLFTLIYFLFFNGIQSLSNKDIIYFIFIITTFSISMTENYLNNNAGIIYVSLISTILIYGTQKK